jgi:thioredoxin reductase (NADPH)
MQVNKIKVLLDYEIISIANDKVDIKHNITHEVLHIPYQVVLVQYGQSINRNNLEPFKNVAVNSVGRIVVKINQMTSIENIYAIGDVCIYEGKPSSLICAHGEAAVAVRDIVNRIKQYDKK